MYSIVVRLWVTSPKSELALITYMQSCSIKYTMNMDINTKDCGADIHEHMVGLYILNGKPRTYMVGLYTVGLYMVGLYIFHALQLRVSERHSKLDFETVNKLG